MPARTPAYKQNASRRQPNMNMFTDCDLRAGDSVQSVAAPWCVAEVVDTNQIMLDGRRMSLSAAATKVQRDLGRYTTPIDGGLFWMHEGRRLYDIRNGLCPPDADGMRIVSEYRHRMHGMRVPSSVRADIEASLASIHVMGSLCKVSQETRKMGEVLFSPVAMNRMFKQSMQRRGWACEVRANDYFDSRFDFKKGRTIVEMQLGKYSFFYSDLDAVETEVSSGAADFAVFLGPAEDMVRHMSSGPCSSAYCARRLNKMCELTPNKYNFPIWMAGFGP